MELSDTKLKQLILKVAKAVAQLEFKAIDQKSKITTLTNEITDLKKKEHRHRRGTSVEIV